jgi:hypothetical protein
MKKTRDSNKLAHHVTFGSPAPTALAAAATAPRRHITISITGIIFTIAPHNNGSFAF